MHKVSTFWQQLYQQSQDIDLQHMAVANMQLNHNLAVSATVDTSTASWLPSPAKGVKRLVLERQGGEKTIRATSIVAYAANSQFSPHIHPKGEEFFVLAGTFSDQHGDYPANTYVRNPPGSSHQPFSREGCLIWVKLQQFAADDQQHIVINVGQKSANVSNTQVDRKVLFDDYETIEWVEVKKSCTLSLDWQEKGAEILVLSGELNTHQQAYPQGHWLRLSPGTTRILSARKNSRFLIKYGHLA